MTDLKRAYFILLTLCLLNTPLITIVYAEQKTESAAEPAVLDFPLNAELDPTALKKLQTPVQPPTSMPVTLWVGALDRIENGVSFLSALPAQIGILINPFDALSPNVLALLTKQKRRCALVIPTRSRFDGEEHSPATLNTTKESHAYFEQIVVNTKISTIFIPNMVDVDQEVLEFIVALAKKHKLTLIIPSQVFANIQKLCDTQSVSYHLLDAFAHSNLAFDDFKTILGESTHIMENMGELKMAVLITDEQKKNSLMEHIHLIQSHKGLFVDEKPLIQAK